MWSTKSAGGLHSEMTSFVVTS